MSIGIASNFYAEKNTLPSFLKMATAGYFDDVVMIHAPPAGAKPDEESIEIVKAAGVRLVHTTIDKGFGVVRTRCIRESQAEWVFILDCDERFYEVVPVLCCEGDEKYPEVKKPKLTTITIEKNFDQGAKLKQMMSKAPPDQLAICLSRRHWFCEPGKTEQPCQNFTTIKDWQLRLVRNNRFVAYDPWQRMHEKLIDCRTWNEPKRNQVDPNSLKEPFISHHHMWAKSLDGKQNAEDLATYKMLDEAGTKEMWIRSVPGNE